MKRRHLEDCTKPRPFTRISAVSPAPLRQLWVRLHVFSLHRLPLSLFRKVLFYLSDFIEYQIYGNVLTSQNVSSGIAATKFLSTTLSDGGRYCRVDSQHILYVGGRPGSAEAVMVSLDCAEVRPVSPMNCGRSDAGVIKSHRTVYVFGGFQSRTALASTEAFQLSTEKWRRIVDMPRATLYYFTPCKYCKEIYLPICDSTSKMLVFTPKTERFSELPVKFSALKGHSVAVIVGEEMVVVSASRAAGRWRIREGSAFTVKTLQNDIATDFAVFSRPLVVGRTIYWMRYAYFIRTNMDAVPIQA